MGAGGGQERSKAARPSPPAAPPRRPPRIVRGHPRPPRRLLRSTGSPGAPLSGPGHLGGGKGEGESPDHACDVLRDRPQPRVRGRHEAGGGARGGPGSGEATRAGCWRKSAKIHVSRPLRQLPAAPDTAALKPARRTVSRAQRGSEDLRCARRLGTREPTRRNNCSLFKTERSERALIDVTWQNQDSPHFLVRSNTAIAHSPSPNLQAGSPAHPKGETETRRPGGDRGGAGGQERGGAPLVLPAAPASGDPNHPTPPSRRRKSRGCLAGSEAGAARSLRLRGREAPARLAVPWAPVCPAPRPPLGLGGLCSQPQRRDARAASADPLRPLAPNSSYTVSQASPTDTPWSKPGRGGREAPALQDSESAFKASPPPHPPPNQLARELSQASLNTKQTGASAAGRESPARSKASLARPARPAEPSSVRRQEEATPPLHL
ncbi:unnamed protein product [Rangifer tarandus platyrhynchus]|uniref:Uncharacterized protein n=1 Tax=Rangifer tarandus platyrhynchus TaxID=3082113 RepID=A0ABN8Y7P5_RANTA|nr:unnamed protein product [Rangifer tarandus platyrhynchus]